MDVKHTLITIAALALAGCSPATEEAGTAGDQTGAARTTGSDGQSTAPLLDGIGPVHFPISTESEQAQAYFDQGLTLSYAFNHAEAARSFREAARLDPTCGICWWGAALVLGPNINAEMNEADVPKAWAALQQAMALAEHETPKEQAYIDALSTRYTEDGADRAALDKDYAEAMAELAAEYPDDLHAQVLYAESLMDLYPWEYWNDDGSPREHTAMLVSQLEQVMAADPEHPGALHLYIHAMEKFTPKKAEPAADRLGPLVPVAGHLVHMPSHIYLRVGRYHDAVTANAAAAESDEDYIAQCNAQGFYPAAYYPHNIHFLWYSAMMEGRKALSVDSARKLVSKVPLEMAMEFAGIQQYLAVPMFTYVRFEMWDEALAEPEPAEGLVIAGFMRHYGRGVALAATGNVEGARAELAALQKIADSGELEASMFRQGDIAGPLTTIATSLVEARIARHGGDNAAEIEHLKAAVAAQDALPYSEPPYWHYPIRQALGSAYLRAGQHQLAADTFAEDLDNFPDNGWSLYGLSRAYAALGKATDELDQALEVAWQYSDIEPTSG